MLHCSGGVGGRGVVALSFRGGGGRRGRAGWGGRLFGFVAVAHGVGGVGGMYCLHANVGGLNRFGGGGDGGEEGGGSGTSDNQKFKHSYGSRKKE